MEKKTKVNLGGKMVDAIEMDFKTKKEEWNEYEVSDGTTLRLKAVTSTIVKVVNEFDTDGNPVYVVKSSTVLAVSSPEHVKKGSSTGMH